MDLSHCVCMNESILFYENVCVMSTRVSPECEQAGSKPECHV